MKTPREIAEGIVGSSVRRCIHDWYPLPELGDSAVETLEAAIASAIQAERDANTPPAVVWTCKPPKGYVLTDEGVARRVLGELPMTADGCVVMPGIEVFHPQQDFSFHLEVMALHGDERQDDDYPLPEDCEYMGHYSYYERDTGYSTYESYDVRACYSTREAAEAAKKETT